MPEVQVRIDFNVNDTNASLGALLRALCQATAAGPVHIDLSDCRFLGPMAVTTLVLAHREWLADQRTVRVTGPRDRKLAAYCVFSGLAERLGFGPPPDINHIESVTTPLRVFTKRDNNAIREVTCLVGRFVEMSERTNEVLNILIGELVQNVADHAGGEGTISARVFKQKKDVRVCVADHGVGLRTSLAGAYGAEVPNDDAAVRLSLERGRSSKSQVHNAGQGLNLMDHLLEANGGEMLLASGFACYARVRQKARFESLEHPFPGALCLMRFRIDNDLYGPDDNDEDDIW